LNSLILPVVLYGRETLSLTLKKERRLRGFESREVPANFHKLNNSHERRMQQT